MATFFASSPLSCERTRSIDALTTSASGVYVRPFAVIDTTRNPITMLVFESVLRFSSVTSIETVEPAGSETPFVPVTLSVSDALKRSPTLLVLVHTFEPDASASDVPEAIVPVLGPRVGAGAGGVGAGAGWLAGGFVRGGVVRGRDGVVEGVAAGTSFSCG